MWISVHQAISKDILTISDILDEAAQWLEWHSLPLGREDEVSLEGIRPDIEAGLFYLAFYADVPAGVIKFQEDPLFWSDVPDGDSAFIHRLAVWRIFAGGSVSTALLNWAVSHARVWASTTCDYDCAADRPRLRFVYERFGFLHHSDRQVGPFFVARYEYVLLADA